MQWCDKRRMKEKFAFLRGCNAKSAPSDRVADDANIVTGQPCTRHRHGSNERQSPRKCDADKSTVRISRQLAGATKIPRHSVTDKTIIPAWYQQWYCSGIFYFSNRIPVNLLYCNIALGQVAARFRRRLC